MIDIDILYSGSAVVFSNLALGRLVLFVKRWFISHIIFPVHGPSSPGGEKPWESRILYGEYGVSSRWEWEWLNNAQHMGMARNKWFNTKICHSHLLNHLFWAHGSTQWFNNIAGSCWVDLDRERAKICRRKADYDAFLTPIISGFLWNVMVLGIWRGFFWEQGKNIHME